jgi:hypothetical protein
VHRLSRRAAGAGDAETQETEEADRRHKQASQETGKENKPESPAIDRENKPREDGQEEKKYQVSGQVHWQDIASSGMQQRHEKGECSNAQETQGSAFFAEECPGDDAGGRHTQVVLIV